MRRLSGAAAVAVLWTTVGVAALRTGFPLLGERPLSWMVADPASSGLFQGGLLAAAVLFVVFHAEVRRRYPVGPGFSVAMLGGMAAQAIAALVPIDGGGASYRLHTVAALVLGASLPVLMWRYAAAQASGWWRHRAYGLFWIELAACVIGLALSRASVAPVAEIVPAAAFHLWVLTLTFAGPAPREGAATTRRAFRPWPVDRPPSDRLDPERGEGRA